MQVSFLLVLLLTVSAPAAAAELFEFNIPAAPADVALGEYARVTGIKMLFRYDEVSQRQTNAVHGKYDADEALRLLLTNTGLAASFSDRGNLIIRIERHLRDHAVTKTNTHQPSARQPSFFKRALTALGVLATAVTASSAAAQDGDERPQIIEEIVVTAQKREQSLEKTPVAVTAITAEMIEKIDVSDINVLSQLAPSFTYNEAYAGVQLYIRGVGQDAPTIGNDPGVAVYVDGVYQGHQFANTATAVDTARFEVLRGPQGTLYGRNSTGGNINIHSVKPHFEHELKINAMLGSDDLGKYSITANLPVKENVLAVRGTIMTHERDGYRTNLFNGNDVDKVDTQAANLSVLVTPSDAVEIILRADYQKDEGGPRPTAYIEAVPGSGPNPLAFGGRAAGIGDTDIYSELKSTEETELKGVSATIDWQFDAVSLKSITSYRESERVGIADAEGTDLAFSINDNYIETEELWQEFNLLGSAYDERLSWIVGLNYYRDEAIAGSLFELPVFALLFPPLPPLPTLDGRVTTTPFLDGIREVDLTSVGMFAQGTVDLTEATSLTLGYRYTREEKDVTVSVFSNITPPAAHCLRAKDSETWHPSTFKLSLDHEFDDGSLGYVSASRGFKAGGFNTGACGGSAFDEEIVDALEIGYKKRFFEGRLVLSSALFYYDYTDLQVRQLTPNLSVEFQNAAEAEVYGLESEWLLQLSENWRIDGGFNWQRAEYKKGFLDDAMVPGIDETDVSGNRLLRAPDLKGNLGIQYTHWLPSGATLEARYDASYSDELFVDAHENDFARIDDRTIQNFRLTWTNAPDSVYVQLFVNNLTDEEYLEWLITSPATGGTAGSWAAPRVYGLRFGYRTP